MTPEEAIKIAIHCFGVQVEQEVCEECPVYLESGIACREVARVAISALEEIQQYREIGTVEEFREAREKQIPKAPIMKPYYEDMPDEEYLCCPTCGDILTDRIPDDNKNFYFHCLNCRQKFDWREEDTK